MMHTCIANHLQRPNDRERCREVSSLHATLEGFSLVRRLLPTSGNSQLRKQELLLTLVFGVNIVSLQKCDHQLARIEWGFQADDSLAYAVWL